MRKIIFVILLLPFMYTAVLAQTLKIATDENMWYPYSYMEEDESKGLHVDVVRLVLKNLGYSFSLTPLPWKRALALTKNGLYDAIISSSYNPDRATYLYYPHDANLVQKSVYRISQVEYSIVTYIDLPYEFDGNVGTLPYPVRGTLGYSVVDDLIKEGIAVDVAPGDIHSFKKLLRDQDGCIVTLRQIANMLVENPEFKGKIKTSKVPFKSKSYFLIFSKKSHIQLAERKKIWQEVRNIRDDVAVMEKLLEKYKNQRP